MSVNEQIKLIADRIAYMRDVLDMSETEVAEGIGISTEEYLMYERGEKDIPISIIYKTASVLGIDSTELLVGDAPRMSEYCITRKGCGVGVERFEGYKFESLAHNFIGRDKEPMIVTITPSEKKADQVSHSGQEFNYVLEGTIGISIGSKEFILHEGDSIYFKPSIPHGQFAVGGTAKFLTIIDKE